MTAIVLAEEWVAIPDHATYEVSSYGRVRRRFEDGTTRPMKASRTSKGYLKVNLTRRAQRYVHRLVMLAFDGPCPPGHQVDHVDFDRTNNRRGNLRYLHGDDNRWRWAVTELDPAELARVDAKAAAAAEDPAYLAAVGW